MVLKDCTVCAVYESDDTLLSKVRVKCNEDRIVLYFFKKDELVDSERIRIDFYDGAIGYIKTYCEIFVRKNYDPIIPEPWMAECEILEVMDIIQRHNDLRVKMQKEIAFYANGRGEFTGVIQNVSVGGIYFISKAKLEPEDEIQFRYTFIKREYDLKAVVLRDQDMHDGRHGYGCQFIRLPNSAERDIRQYVYKQQLSYVI